MTTTALRTLTTLALTLGLAGLASAQIPGSNYSAAPAIFASPVSTGVTFVRGLQQSTVNQAADVIGTSPLNGFAVTSGDVLTDLGGGNFRLELRIRSVDNLAPLGFPINGTPSDQCGLLLGESLPRGVPLEFANDRAAFITSAQFSVLNTDGSRMLGPSNALPAFSGLNDPDFGGGWSGSVTILFPQSQLTGAVGGYDLVLDYRLGVASDYDQIWNSGCNTFGQPGARLEPISPTVLGIPMTFEMDTGATPNLALAGLFLGATANGNGMNFGMFGAPQCNLLLDDPFYVEPMSIGSSEARSTILVPSDPGLAGLSLAVQAVGLASDGSGRVTGVSLSNLGLLIIGG